MIELVNKCMRQRGHSLFRCRRVHPSAPDPLDPSIISPHAQYPDGEAAISSGIDTGDVSEQPWNVDGAQARTSSSLLDILDGTSSTITDERGASFTSALSPLLHPVSWCVAVVRVRQRKEWCPSNGPKDPI
jgi:hypothetical protein